MMTPFRNSRCKAILSDDDWKRHQMENAIIAEQMHDMFILEESAVDTSILPMVAEPDFNPYESKITTSDQKEKLSYLWALKNFMERCTGHGCAKVFANSFTQRVIWALLVTVFVFIFIVQSGLMFVDVSTYPTTLSIMENSKMEMQFPAITICNNNKLRRSELRKLPEGHRLRKSVDMEAVMSGNASTGLNQTYEAELLMEVNELMNDSSWITSSTASNWLTMSSDAETAALGHQWQPGGMLVTCSVDQSQCEQPKVTVERVMSQSYGNCYTVKIPETRKKVGVKRGVSMMVSLEVFEYNPLFAPDASLKLFITEPGRVDGSGRTVVDFSRELTVGPGFKHNVKIDLERRSKLPPPYSECQEYGGTSLYLSKYHCVNHCLNKHKAAYCGCVDDAAFAASEGVDLCTAGQGYMECVAAVELQTRCPCSDPCEELQYTTRLSASKWPISNALLPLLPVVNSTMSGESAEKFLNSIVEAYINDDAERAAEIFRGNFARLNFFLKDMTETHYEERAVYDAVTVMSNLGGLMGFYLGLSVISLFEVIDLWFDLKMLPFHRRRLAILEAKEHGCK